MYDAAISGQRPQPEESKRMAKVTLEQIECDVCRKVGERYTLSYPDGIKVLDRCDKHATKIFALKEEPGDWTALSASTKGRTTLKVSTPEDIERQRRNK